MDFPILIIWTSQLSFAGGFRVVFNFRFIFSMKIMSVNRIAPDGMSCSAASHLGLFCLPMSHKKDARLILVEQRNC